jgi:DNA-directed RNA polymerase specialized sigma24 family protein
VNPKRQRSLSSRSDTSLLDLLRREQSPAVAQQLWERYFHRVAGLARMKLAHVPRRSVDEEDVALSAFDSFFRGVDAGRFPQLEDREDLWQVLMMLADRKAVDQRRRANAEKRGGGKVRGDSAFLRVADSGDSGGLQEAIGSEPSPEFIATVTDECRRLFQLLDDPELRVVALLKMEGFNTEEIARSLERAPRSIERKLHTIRKVWQKPAGE